MVGTWRYDGFTLAAQVILLTGSNGLSREEATLSPQSQLCTGPVRSKTYLEKGGK